MDRKYIFVTGGVVSSLGKGITAASLGRLLKERGYKVTVQKCDPYLNVDPGTMSPYQHGEVFVTKDGAEADLDLGHYERFIDEELTRYNTVTSGKILSNIINNERKGNYLGGTVQYVPHVTNEIKTYIKKAGEASNSDIVITEIGGTVGDIESDTFIEAIRQIRKEVGRENILYIHVTLLPYVKAAGELKTKPTQQSVKMLQGRGVFPDVIVLRSEKEITKEVVSKISLFCDVDENSVIPAYDASNLYQIPLNMEDLGLASVVCKKLNLIDNKPSLKKWRDMVDKIDNYSSIINIAIVGKYVELKDAYISIHESIEHAAFSNGIRANIKYFKSDDVDINELKSFDGILIPGGFGSRGIDGKINTIKYARENKVPFLGICLGMQMATIEFARNVLKIKDANTTEIDENTKHPVITLISEQKETTNKGGTMRLGSYECILSDNTLAKSLYKEESIIERHRHRYEFNPEYKEEFIKNGFNISGTSKDKRYVEIVEIKDHPFFIASQFHPEFKSRPNKPHPLFVGFVKACLEENKKNN